MTIAWFPPAEVTGLHQVTDKKQLADLTRAATANSRFWISRPNNRAKPIVFGRDATSILSTSPGFATALIVPVREVKPTPAAQGSPDLGIDVSGKPVGYEVVLSGAVGDTSFGLRPTSTPGEWLLDPNGELLNWGNAIDSVSRVASFTAEQAYVTRSAFDLTGKPALFLSWAVFRDANGKQYAATLHSPPPIKATWAIADKPLRIGSVYDTKVIFGPVTLTPTK